MYRIGQRVGGNTWAKEHDNILSVALAPMGVVSIVENDDVP